MYTSFFLFFFSEKKVTEEDCALTEWGPWTKCVKSCGIEPMFRSRSFIMRDNEVKCLQKFKDKPLKESMDCGNPPCPEETFVSSTNI